MRQQCPESHWFEWPGPCPYGPPGDPCGYVPPPPEEPPPPIRENFDRQVAAPDRDALRVMPDDRQPVHAGGFAAARKALAEAEWKKRNRSKESSA